MITQNTCPSRRLPPDNFYRHQHPQQFQLHNQQFQQIQPQQQHQYNYSQNYNYTYSHNPQQIHTYNGLLASDSSAYPTTLDNTPTVAAAQAALDNYQKKFDFLNIQSPMSSEPLLFHDHPTQKHTHAQRFGHQRDASSSSVGSNTPVSPYSASTENHRIAVSGPVGSSLHEMASAGDNSYSYVMTNNHGPLDAMKGRGMNAMSVMGDPNSLHGLPALMGAQQQRQGGLAHASGRSESSPSTKSRPVSVASSICGDSPATPPYREHEDEHRRIKNGEEPDSPILLFLGQDPDSDQKYFDDCLQFRFDDLAFDSGASIPRLDRTATDAYYDELLPQELTMTSSSSPPPQNHVMRSPNSDLFAQRLQAANRQHLRATQSPVSSRAHSPFVQGSPYAMTMNEFPKVGTNQARLESAQQMRERRKAEEDAMQLHHRVAQVTQPEGQHTTPATISPKDAVLEFNETDVESDFTLFPAHDANSDSLGHNNGGNLMDRAVSQHSASPFHSMSGTPVQGNFKFELPPHVNQVLPPYPFVPRQQPQPRHQQPLSQSASAFSRVSSAGGSNTSVSSHDGSSRRPERVSADGGTYTCTYHGCTIRFDTQAQLQKHKREGHRQANVFNHLRSPSGISSSALSSQAGPHRCDRINPSTGKPCNTVFSRPYDLTRHEDTIHNGRKQKVRCHLCTEEKTFSRADALTRHYRVCHPDIPSPTKRRRAVA